MSKTANQQHIHSKSSKSHTAQSGKKEKRDCDVILRWKKGTRPFVYQKLGFRALPGFNNMISDAQAIRNLLIKAGDFEAKDVRIVAVSEAGALEKYQGEHRIAVKKNVDSMLKAVKQAKDINKKPTRIVKPTKTGSTSMRIRG